jgi:hypothetical protein
LNSKLPKNAPPPVNVPDRVAVAVKLVAAMKPEKPVAPAPAEYIAGAAYFHASVPDRVKKILVTPVTFGRAENTSKRSPGVNVMLFTMAPLKEKSQSGVAKFTISCSPAGRFPGRVILTGPYQT